MPRRRKLDRQPAGLAVVSRLILTLAPLLLLAKCLATLSRDSDTRSTPFQPLGATRGNFPDSWESNSDPNEEAGTRPGDNSPVITVSMSSTLELTAWTLPGMAPFHSLLGIADRPLAVVLSGLFAALLVGTVIRLLLLRNVPAEQRQSKLASLTTWWMLALLFGGVVYFGPVAALLLFCVLALLGAHEFLWITAESRRDSLGQGLIYIAIVLQYVWIGLDWPLVALTFIPIALFLLIPIRTVLTGSVTGYLHHVAVLFWGVMLLGYSLSHAPLLFTLPLAANETAAVALLVYLVLLTESNDIAQALWGRQFGHHRITPTLSPNKTWEGFLFGGMTTVLLAMLLSLVIRPPLALPLILLGDSEYGSLFLWSLGAGILIATGGFLGDLNMSGLKRDLGIKDSGTLLPGQGGVLDRIDSLSFTAPLFYYYVRMTCQ
jgi:phosphatidate cytidylyltransferase